MTRAKVIRNILIVMTLIPIIVISVMTALGEGMTFQSVVANIRAEQAFREISRGDYNKATNYIGFWGILQEGDTADYAKISVEREIFVSELKDFFSEPSREFESYRVYDFRTDDRYTTGYTELMIVDDNISYSIAIELSFSQDKLCPMRIDAIMTDNEGSLDINAMPGELMKIMKTHYSG